MAIRIRCSDCRKKILIDEAFAGGVCRCPYCTALVFVPAVVPGSSQPGRPERPGRRPASPGSRPAAPGAEAAVMPERTPREAIAAAESEGAEVPVATPVRIQGIATIVMLLVLLALLGGGGYFVVSRMGGSGDDDNDNGTKGAGNGTRTDPPNGTGKLNPFISPGVLGPGIDGMKIDSPIIYCIEGGSSMGRTLNYAAAMTRVSIRSLTAEHKFNVLLGEEGGEPAESWYRFVLDGYKDGGEAGEQAVAPLLDEVTGAGAPNVSRLVKAALAYKPKPRTIVFFACKPVDEAGKLGKLAKAQDVLIVTICLTDEAAIAKTMAKLAETSGGTGRAHSARDLNLWAEAAKFE